MNIFFCLPSEQKAIKFHRFISKFYKGDLSHITALEYFGYNCQPYMNHRELLFKSLSDVGIYLQIPLYNQTVEDVAENWLEILLKSFNKSLTCSVVYVYARGHPLCASYSSDSLSIKICIIHKKLLLMFLVKAILLL